MLPQFISIECAGSHGVKIAMNDRILIINSRPNKNITDLFIKYLARKIKSTFMIHYIKSKHINKEMIRCWKLAHDIEVTKMIGQGILIEIPGGWTLDNAWVFDRIINNEN